MLEILMCIRDTGRTMASMHVAIWEQLIVLII